MYTYVLIFQSLVITTFMASDDKKSNQTAEKNPVWSSTLQVRQSQDRRSNIDRREVSGRAITVPDLRSNKDRRSGNDRRKVTLTITGRARNT